MGQGEKLRTMASKNVGAMEEKREREKLNQNGTRREHEENQSAQNHKLKMVGYMCSAMQSAKLFEWEVLRRGRARERQGKGKEGGRDNHVLTTGKLNQKCTHMGTGLPFLTQG